MRLADLCPIPLPTGFNLPLEVHLGAGLRATMPEVVATHIPGAPLLVMDPDTAAAAGPLGLDGHTLVLPAHPHADDPTVQRVVDALGDAPGLVAVGSGTVNDLCKRAGAIAGRPFVVLGTAASMNGYASGIAAILSGGVKTTVPSAPARAIVLDTKILAAAPPAMAQAGLGDLMSKPVSDTCWWLAAELEGGGYSTLPSQIVDHAVARAQAVAAGLRARDPVAHGVLGEALVLSGVAMVVAGSSSPASGGEHLLSHLWDMENLLHQRPTRLHGAQVGVASIISAALYQRLLRTEAPSFAAPPLWPAEVARIRAEFGGLADAILPHAKAKHTKAQARVETLRARWPELRDGLMARKLPTPDEIRAPLLAAGAPTTLAALGISRAEGARVLRLAKDIRARVTVLDVAADLGVLPGAIDEVLNDAGV